MDKNEKKKVINAISTLQEYEVTIKDIAYDLEWAAYEADDMYSMLEQIKEELETE